MSKFFIYAPGMPITAEIMERRSLGGSESAAAYLAAALAARKHDVALFTSHPQPGQWRGVTLLPIGPQSDAFPLGGQFETVVAAMPHDVLLVQRVPRPFPRRYAARFQGWWVHDILRKRQEALFKSVGWACDGVFAVSDWHRKQAEETLTLPPGYVQVLRNGVDLDLFKTEPSPERKLRGKKLLYTSRPERGLEHLVKPGGIMERLGLEYTLQVATYDHPVPDLAELYDQLYRWGQERKNVEFLPAQSKQGVADLMTEATLLVYPVIGSEAHENCVGGWVAHEETSCISVMEAQCGGTPVIACDGGAIRETLGDGAGELIPYGNNQPDIDKFVERIGAWTMGVDAYTEASTHARERGMKTYSVEQGGAVDTLESLAIHSRTIVRGVEARDRRPTRPPPHGPVRMAHLLPELQQRHLARLQSRGPVHYRSDEEAVVLRDCDVRVMGEFEAPHDLVLSDHLLNSSWAVNLVTTGEGQLMCFAAVLRAPEDHFLAPCALDLDAMLPVLEALPEFNLCCSPAILDEETGLHAQVGWLCWRAGEGTPDLRVVRRADSRERLSVLMIAKESAEVGYALEPLLKIADEVVIGVDASDPPDPAAYAYWKSVEVSDSRIKVFRLEKHPLVDGFDAARNEVLARCTGDWVLWVDADELLTYPLRLPKYLRRNAIAQGYAVRHQHVAEEGVLKMDLPCRLIRRDAGLEFVGLVHEHPIRRPDEAPKYVSLIGDMTLLHPGYASDEIRRKRFERNWPLMQRDRQVNPGRMLGQLLWIRDLAQKVRFERITQRRGPGTPLTPEHKVLCDEGLAMWQTILDRVPTEPHALTFLGETLQYVSELTLLRHGMRSVRFNFGFDVWCEGIGGMDPQGRPQPRDVAAVLPTQADVEKLVKLLVADKVKPLVEKYR